MVVGLGASAGGIKALSAVFANVPPRTGMAYVVILHLSPDYESRLAEVLQTSAAIPVTQVVEEVRLEPDHVYVISPNQLLNVEDGRLRLEQMTALEERQAPVDMFFRTLASAYGPRAAAVVLSGTGPNGSNGLKRIKEHGGLTIAQDPLEAEYQDMPRNSIATGLVDYVVRAAYIPAHILRYQERLGGGEDAADEGRSVDELSVAVVAPADARVSKDWRDVLTLLRVRTGHDFSNYKPATLRRRVERRMNVRGLATLTDYANTLRDQPAETVALMKELLISVTNFFRDPESFAVLERRVIPVLFSGKDAGDHVRVWSAGCATGEEAYSLAMLLAEHAGTLPDPPSIQVFATDLDQDAITVARDGVYSEADVADLSAERLQRFFHRDPAGYRVRRDLRELVLFAHHNVIRDPPFSHIDLISCRNLLIYLNRPVQDRLLETFHFALRPNGYLFLGTSESADGGTDFFVTFDKEAHIFESRMVGSRPPLPIGDRWSPPPPNLPASRRPEQQPLAEAISPGDLHLRLLERYASPSIVVNDQYIVVHVSATANRFLAVPSGEPSGDILRMVLPALQADLRAALHIASRDRTTASVGGVRLEGEVSDVVRIVVKPVLRDGQPPRGYFLVLFEPEKGPPSQAANETHRISGAEFDPRRLEDDLALVKTQLRLTIEQYETHSEEARAANEELQAMNEELRSAAEELETSKEELQSVNEELTTVNQELKIKIDELGLTNNDFHNLINSTDIGTIFLDRKLRVKLSTPAAQRIFNLLPSDAGRRLSDITSRLKDESVHEDVVAVLERLKTIEREVESSDGHTYLMRILPYRTTDDRIDGVSITFHDITAWRQAELRERASEERLRLLIDTAIDYAIFTLTEDGRVDSWNPGAERMFRFTADEILGRDVAILFTPEDRAHGMPARELEEARQNGRASDERWHVRKDGTRLFCSGVTTRLGDGLGFAKIARDLTSRREAELQLERARAQLEARVAERTLELQGEVSRHATARQEVTSLLRRVVTAQEEQSARISRDLHDELGQQLTSLRMSLERLRDAQPAAKEEIDQALATTREIDRQIDFLAWELRPAALDDLGLAAALPQFLQEWSAHHGVASRFQTGSIPARLPSQVETAFYRIAQESLTNVIKHAHASRVDVVLEAREDAVVLIVEDDGIGFDVTDDTKHSGIGLAGMRERAALIGATLQVESSPSGGTTVFLRYPFAADHRQP